MPPEKRTTLLPLCADLSALALEQSGTHYYSTETGRVSVMFLFVLPPLGTIRAAEGLDREKRAPVPISGLSVSDRPLPDCRSASRPR